MSQLPGYIYQPPPVVQQPPPPRNPQLGEGEGAYKIVKGKEAGGKEIIGPSYLFPAMDTSGTPLMWGTTGSATVARNVETGQAIPRKAGDPENFGLALQIASKYNSQAPQMFTQSVSYQEYIDSTQAQKTYQEQQKLKAGWGGSFPSVYSEKIAMAPIGSPIPTPKQYEQIKYLQSGSSQWKSEAAFKSAAEPLMNFGYFAGEKDFRGNIIQPQQSLLPPPTPLSTYEGSPFGKGLIKSEDFPGKSGKRYPNTPIDYSKTHLSEVTTFPIFKGAAGLSSKLSTYYEAGTNLLPFPETVKEPIRGFGSVFTSLPEYVSSGISGIEYAAREPEQFKKNIIPAVSYFGTGMIEQAKERPLYTGGQIVGMAFLSKKLTFKGKTPPSSVVDVKPSTFRKMFGYGKTSGASMEEVKTGITPTFEKVFGHRQKPSTGASLESFKSEITPSLKKTFGERKTPSTGASIEDIKVSVKNPVKKMFGERQTKPTGASMEEIRSSLSSPINKMLGYSKPIVPSPITTWNLIPTKEYYQGKFSEFNVFRGGNIEGLAAYLKSLPTAPKMPRQMRPVMPRQTSINVPIRGMSISELNLKPAESPKISKVPKMPKQISLDVPITSIKVSKPSAKPKPSGTEIKTSSGMVLIQKQKTVQIPKTIQKMETIVTPKYGSMVATKTKLRPVIISARASLQPAVRVRTSAKTKTMLKPTVRTSTKTTAITATRPMIRTASMTITKTKPMTAANTMTRTRTMAASMTSIKPATKTMTAVKVISRKVPRPKQSFNALKKPRGTGKKFKKFTELSRVAAPKDFIKGGLTL